MAAPNRGIGTSGTDLAVQDLSRRLGVSKDQIKIQSAEDVEWNDASLGCPQPGQMYAQVITPGFKVVLEANGKTYEYHGSGNRVVQCNK